MAKVILIDDDVDLIKMNEVFDWMKGNPDYYVLCAKYNNKVVGSLMGVLTKELFGECKPFMVIENVVVSDECRRMGIGKMLMDRMEAIARENECTVMMLISSMHRKEAHLFYESIGFSGDVGKGFRKYL